MASRQFQGFTHFFSLLLLLGSTGTAMACGWGFTRETVRLAFFRAEVPGMKKFRPFYYTSDYYFQNFSGIQDDRHRNCLEWQVRLGGKSLEKDIYTIQYETDPATFEQAYVSKSLLQAFPGNKFIKTLLLPQNKPLLEYMAFAKRMEHSQLVTDSGWESWEYGVENPYPADPHVAGYIKKQLANEKDTFLKQRYAFMLIRFGENTADVAKLYDTYFEGTHTVIKNWALFFKAMVTKDKALQNYYLSLVFDQGDDKIFGIMQNFNRAEMRESLQYAKSDHEKAVLLSMYAFRNPGPAQDEISEIYRLEPNSPYINVLIAREINKLEDWVLSPVINNDTPSVNYTGKYNWEQAVRDQNLIKDKGHLKQFRAWLTGIYPTTAAGQKDFIAGAIAHLCYMEDDVVAGKRYASLISDSAHASIRAQKELELSLIALKEQGLQSAQAQDKVTDAINAVCKLAEEDRTLLKGAYSMLRILSKVYEEGGDIATAGLLYKQSENYAVMNSTSPFFEEEPQYLLKPGEVHYYYIDFYDSRASTADMDRVLSIIDKKDKNRFEAFICRGTITDRNLYLDLKGTIAFRADNLQLAYEVFSAIPDTFYKKEYAYASYLNEDPFFPRILLYKYSPEEKYYVYAQTNYNYDFNKARFVKQLIDLKKSNSPASYMQLAHAYFNTSSYGNAWMMCEYSNSWGGRYGDNALEEDSSLVNYYNLKLCIYYYNKVLQTSNDKEQLALASLMLHKCKYLLSYSAYDDYSESFLNVYDADSALVDFYTKYRNTKVFKTYNCPMLESFLR